jgi:hypothetical protein
VRILEELLIVINSCVLALTVINFHRETEPTLIRYNLESKSRRRRYSTDSCQLDCCLCVLRVIISGCIREPVLRLEASGPVARVVISSCITISAVC